MTNKIQILVSAVLLAATAAPALAGALHEAIQQGDAERVKAEIEAGADVAEEDFIAGYPIIIAAAGGSAKIVELLLEHGASAEVEVQFLGTPLHVASYDGHLGVVETLIAHGVDVNIQTDSDGKSPLHSAAEAGHVEIVKFLVRSGADMNLKGRKDFTPAHSAGTKGHFDVVDVLIELGWSQPAVEPISDRLANVDIEKARKLYGQCGRCHAIVKGSKEGSLGPNLWNIVGRQIASEDFNYSEGLKRVGGKWTYERLNSFLAGPREFAPGTNMRWYSVTDPNERAELIAYMRQLSNSPAPMP